MAHARGMLDKLAYTSASTRPLLCTHTYPHTQLCNTYCFPRQQGFRKRTAMLRYLYTACRISIAFMEEISNKVAGLGTTHVVTTGYECVTQYLGLISYLYFHCRKVLKPKLRTQGCIFWKIKKCKNGVTILCGYYQNIIWAQEG
jgi:hypothetical protein